MIAERAGMTRRLSGLMLGASVFVFGPMMGVAMGQGAPAATGAPVSSPAVSSPVVQQVPVENDASRALAGALARVGRNPRDVEALAEAGDAAMGMGDAAAAAGFYTRAEKLAPGNAHVALGFAEAKLRGDDPAAAITLFERAAAGANLDADQTSDRGLAHDLVGDNASAQRFYREALAKGGSDEVMRRMALSQAIAGDRKAVETTLAPLLQKQDRAAWRTRAFAFAILGREEEAVAIARSTMPAELANGMAPYLRFMRKLTPAQQAAAANLGQFPRASEIGQDDPRVVAYAAQHGVKRLAAVDAPLVPAGTPLGAAATTAPATSAPVRAATPPPEPQPSREVVQPPALASAEPRRMPVVSQPVVQTVPKPAVQAAPKPAAEQTVQGPGFAALTPEKPKAAAGGFDLARLPAPETSAPVTGPVRDPAPVAAAPVQTSVSAPAPVVAAPVPVVERKPEPPVETKLEPKPEPKAPSAPQHQAAPKVEHKVEAPKAASSRKASFADAFGEWGRPQPDKANVAPASGAVDLRKISPKRPEPKAPPPPANPSRVWVQIGVGRDPARILYDWRKMNKDEPELFKGQKVSMSDWGRTNRVLVGPFDDEGEAKAFESKLKKAGHDGVFMWLSPNGQAVDPVGK